jgi:outer membrane protein assembly factor BamB
VDGSSAYFLSRRHEVLAVDTATGTVRWKQHTGEPGDTTGGYAVVLSGDIVAAGDDNVIAFDRQTGAMRWRFVAPGDDAPGLLLGGAAGGLIFTGSPIGRMAAIDDRTGSARWTFTVAGIATTTVFPPAADGDVVAAGYTTELAPLIGGIVAVDAVTGAQRWRTEFPRPSDPLLSTNAAGTPIFVDDLVIASSGDGVVYAFDRTNGSIRWSIPRLEGPLPGTSISPDRDHRPLARAGGLLVVGSLTSYVVAYDMATRQERWRFSPRLDASVAFAVVTDDRVAYVPYFSGTTVAVDLSSGTELWRFGNWRQGFFYPAALFGDRVYVAGVDGGFVALPSPWR